MSSEKTEQQTNEEIQLAQDMSLDKRKPPSDIPGYSLQQFVGSGAYGEVWSGIDRKTGRKVAIKFYTRKTSLDFTMLSREVEKLVYLAADRYVVQLLDVGWDAKPPYYVMDYIENGSLEDELKLRTTMPVDEAVELFEEIAIGLMHLHGKGILHCDLKPGNVLLDQDKKPRLADFGQSRLSHEQSPALGTLFFMAPEQADLKAVPDARWDVYALGALLYCMLTGNPPYREKETVGKLEGKQGLEARLKAYTRLIQASPKPTAHRSVPGVDRSLGDIIGRCIAADPKNRYTSIQSVLLALRQRKETLARRPLMLLGIIGPLVLLALMSGFAWWAYNDAVSKSDANITAQAIESNRWAAKFAARSVSESIDEYFDAVQAKSEDADFRNLYKKYLENEKLDELAVLLADPNRNEDPALDETRKEYREHDVREDINLFVNEWMSDEKLPKAASWTVYDRYGNQVAGIWDGPTKNTIGKNWSFRSYFHSDQQDSTIVDKDGNQWRQVEDVENRKHITGQKVSAVFLSQASNTWKVAFSVPLYYDDEDDETANTKKFQGIVAVTVEMGEFISFDDGTYQYAMLVNGLDGLNQGIVLEHPLIRKKLSQLKPGDKVPDEISNVQIDFARLKNGATDIEDPLGYNPSNKPGKQQWLAAYVPVIRSPEKNPDSTVPQNTGLFVVTVEDADSVLKPSRDLGQRMVQLGLFALIAFLLVTGGLTYLVFRSLRQANRTVSKFYSQGSESSSTNAVTLVSSESSSTPRN